MEGPDNNPNNANTGANNEPAGANNQNAGANNNPVTFDDFLKDGKNQAEFDRKLKMMLKNQKQKD